MYITFSSIWLAAGAAITYHIVSRVFAKLRNHAEKVRRGCQDLPYKHSIWPFGIGEIQRILKADAEKRFPDDMVERFDEVGPDTHTYEYSMFGTNVVFTRDPKNIQAMLATQFRDYWMGGTRQKAFDPLLGQSILTSDGKIWEHSRALMRPTFARDLISNLEIEERHVQHFLQHLPVDQYGWTEGKDLMPILHQYTLDSSTEFIFGQSVGSQTGALPGRVLENNGQLFQGPELAYLFEEIQRITAKRVRLGKGYWLVDGMDYRSKLRKMHDYVDHLVKAALENSSRARDTEDKASDKKGYFFLKEMVERVRDPVELRNHSLSLLIAGRDTSATLLSWIFYHLVRNQRIFDKLRCTVVDSFGTFDDSRDITFSTLKSCQFLQQVISEALRHVTIVPYNLREARVDTTLPRGGGPDGMSPVFIPKGQQIDFSTHAMHRRKDLWGEDADIFRPERFEGRKSGWDFLRFGGGPRVCIGQQFALTTTSYVLVRLLQRFDKIENLEPEGPIVHDMSFINKPVSVFVKLHEAIG
ncbi:MAG: hypothetical protein M1833_001852 [Piccolia ochrophora]|nr:MAG: hypothetical protein M1833_001852 [Piccolia ochrophora]